MTQNDAASVTPTEARHLAERVVSRTRGYDIKLRDDDSRIAMITDALDAARLQGWNECREAAVKVADTHEANNYDQGEYGSGWAAASRSIADEIEALTPSTPESDHVE